ncbi:MAG TPA: hypothetical protein VEQ17_04860 [Steroidobacteraceae bacterium]|nr:hypothetical protein [Steroidobacteraceae bacterium]
MNTGTGLILALSVVACGAAWAADAPSSAEAQRELLQPPKMRIASPITDRMALRGIFYAPRLATDIRRDASDGTPGTPISGEDMLALPDSMQQGGIDLMFRLLERHRIRAGFYQQNRSGDTVLQETIRFGDDVYQVDDRVLTDMDLRQLDVVYTYSFLRRETVEIGAGLGIHLLQIDGRIEAPATFESEEDSVAGPFATLAVDGTWRFTPRFSLNARANYFKGDADEVRGSYMNWHADVQFRWKRNFALGAGYTYTRMFVDSTDVGDSGTFRHLYRGAEAFARVSF